MWYNTILFPLTPLLHGEGEDPAEARPTVGQPDKETRISEPHAS